MVNKLEMPGLFSWSYFTSHPESVTADMIFFLMVFKSSLRKMSPFGSLLDIFTVGSLNDMMRAPTLRIS